MYSFITIQIVTFVSDDCNCLYFSGSHDKNINDSMILALKKTVDSMIISSIIMSYAVNNGFDTNGIHNVFRIKTFITGIKDKGFNSKCMHHNII